MKFLIFTNQAGESGIEVRYENETIWLTQKLMAELFDVDGHTISEHLRNIFSSGELQQESVIRKFRTTAADGENYNTQFRQWATHVLREFTIKGYALDKKRLENGTFLNASRNINQPVIRSTHQTKMFDILNKIIRRDRIVGQ